jgi:hypothetical protein
VSTSGHEALQQGAGLTIFRFSSGVVSQSSAMLRDGLMPTFLFTLKKKVDLVRI